MCWGQSVIIPWMCRTSALTHLEVFFYEWHAIVSFLSTNSFRRGRGCIFQVSATPSFLLLPCWREEVRREWMENHISIQIGEETQLRLSLLADWGPLLDIWWKPGQAWPKNPPNLLLTSPKRANLICHILFYPQFDWEIIDIDHCISLRCTAW